MTTDTVSTDTDILVVGDGLVGLTAAYALSSAGHAVTLCAPKTIAKDLRTTALLDNSVQYLKTLGLWQELEQQAHPLKTMRLVDGTKRLFRFQQTDFNSAEIGLDAFGYTIRNQLLIDLITKEFANKGLARKIDGKLIDLKDVENEQLSATIMTGGETKTISTRMIVGADGRNSQVRKHFGHGERQWSYPQAAVVMDFEHEIPTSYTSTEFHTETGPFTIVPQTSDRAGLVWLETPDRAAELCAMKDEDLATLLETKMQSFLGKILVKTAPRNFPMHGMTANRVGEKFHALVGEAAHVFPPIGAQGFNLGIRDVEALVRVVNQYGLQKHPGTFYHEQRLPDVTSRTMGVDLLNRSLLSDFLPAQIIKSASMFAFNQFLPLRKQVMRMGIEPANFEIMAKKQSDA